MFAFNILKCLVSLFFCLNRFLHIGSNLNVLLNLAFKPRPAFFLNKMIFCLVCWPKFSRKYQDGSSLYLIKWLLNLLRYYCIIYYQSTYFTFLSSSFNVIADTADLLIYSTVDAKVLLSLFHQHNGFSPSKNCDISHGHERNILFKVNSLFDVVLFMELPLHKH